MKLKYSGILGMDGFTCDIQNKMDGLEISNYDGDKHLKPFEVVDRLLRDFLPTYCKYDTSTAFGKKWLHLHLKEDIEKTKQKLAEQELALKMCQRKKVYFKK